MSARSDLEARVNYNTFANEQAAFQRGELHPKVFKTLMDSVPIGAYNSGTGVTTFAEAVTITGAAILPGGTSAFTTFTDSANGSTLNIKSATVLKSALSGATVTATALIPAGSLVLGVVARVTTLITGATTFKIGDGTTADLWGATVAVALNTVTTGTSFKAATGPVFYPAATDVVLTANGSNFTAGAVRLEVWYISQSGPTA